MTVLRSVSWQQFGRNPMFHCRDTDEREPTSVSWHKAPDDKKSDDMAYDDIKEADLAAGFD